MSHVKKEFTLAVDGCELATILAALRFHQDENLRTGPGIADQAIEEIASDGGSLKPLDFDDVSRLCERMNIRDDACADRRGRIWVLIAMDKSTVMTKTKEEINIARIVYDAYPHSDLLPIDPEQDCRTLRSLLDRVTGESIGDGLFKFVVVEIVEGGEGTLTGAIRVMEQAGADVEAVLQALRDADRTIDNCESEVNEP